jgi:hypothetical protein
MAALVIQPLFSVISYVAVAAKKIIIYATRLNLVLLSIFIAPFLLPLVPLLGKDFTNTIKEVLLPKKEDDT